MRVLFDAFWWERGPGANRTVQREVILAWRRLFPDDDLILALRRGDDDTEASAVGSVVHSRLWPHAAANRWDLPRLARSTGADVCVAHNYTPRRRPSLVFIHDVMFIDHPEWFSVPERAYFFPMIPWARSASVVTTSTATEARRIDRHLRRAPGATVPVGLAVPTPLSAGTPSRPERVPEGSSFALTVGRLNVRKNLISVMRGAAASRSITAQSPLIVVGSTAHSGRGTEFPPDVQSAIAEGRIVLLGAASDDEVAWLYAHAALVMNLSLDEGFGLPALEGASFGAPLLVSDIPVFRETVAGYAAFTDPLGGDAAIGQAIDDAWNRRPDAAAVTAVRERYSWDATATALRSLAARTIA